MSVTQISSNLNIIHPQEYDISSDCESGESSPIFLPEKKTKYILPEPSIHPKMIIGENGALTHNTSGDLGLDLSFKLIRNLDIEELKTRMNQIINLKDKDKVQDLIILAFQTRNCRENQGGKGEKNLFHEMFLHLYTIFPQTCLELLEIIPEYGSWNDLKELVKKVEGIREDIDILSNACMNLFVKQLKTDFLSLESGGDQISLAAKWAPRENSNFYKNDLMSFTYLVTEFANEFKYSQYDVSNPYSFYRKTVSKLNKHLDTPQIKMCDGNWKDIKPSQVSSQTSTKFRKAFLNEKIDEYCDSSHEDTGNRFPDNIDRVITRKNFINSAKIGKIHGGQLQAHEITTKIRRCNSKSEEEILSAQWNDLRSKITTKGARKLIPVCDVSGSMAGTSIDVCVALGLLLSEVIKGPFANRIITFHSNPSWVNIIESKSLKTKVNKLYKAPWMGTTNLKATFDLILEVILKNKIAQEDIPDLVIFSDMQFNKIDESFLEPGDTYLQYATKRFQRAGYTRPNIFFWNLKDSIGIPTPADSNGTVLLSGYSQSLFKYLLFNETPPDEVTPYGIYRNMLDDVVYDRVREVLLQSDEFSSFFSIFNHQSV